MVVAQPYTLNWSSSNATSVKRLCTSTGSGFTTNETMAQTSGSISSTGNSAWVGYSSTCIWTATGPGGNTQVTETMTTVATAPTPPPTPQPTPTPLPAPTTPSTVSVTYVHTDALGSPVARTDEQGRIISRTRYDPYGATVAGATPSIGFTGQVNDPDTGLIYMGQRSYDPLAGRFMSVDPVQPNANTGGSFNLYVYANNSPYNYIDPDGRQARDIQRDCDGGNCTRIGGTDLRRNEAIATGAKVGALAGIAVAAACDVGTGGVCVIGNPAIVATGTFVGGVAGGVTNSIAEKFGGANNNTSAGPPPPDDDGQNTKVKDSTKGRSVRNTDASISRTDFEKNLESNGFQRSPTDNQSVTNFTKGDIKYTVRDFSKSRGPTVDVYRGDLLVQKIRLIGGP
jgi:RHS repeat-associated protein